MNIFYQTETDFYDGILELVKRGIMFNADNKTLTIKLTGGY